MEDNKYSIDTPMDELEKGLLFENNPDQIKEIVDIFNLNIKKKDIVRASKLSELQDKVFNQMNTRIEKRADDFSNKDLLDYFKTIQDTINKSDTSIDMNTPAIQVTNNQQINVDMGDASLTREDKLKVLDVVKSIIGNIDLDKENKNPEQVDGEFEEVLEETEENGSK